MVSLFSSIFRLLNSLWLVEIGDTAGGCAVIIKIFLFVATVSIFLCVFLASVVYGMCSGPHMGVRCLVEEGGDGGGACLRLVAWGKYNTFYGPRPCICFLSV